MERFHQFILDSDGVWMCDYCYEVRMSEPLDPEPCKGLPKEFLPRSSFGNTPVQFSSTLILRPNDISGDLSVCPIKDWVNAHPSRKVTFEVNSKGAEPSTWTIDWQSEHGSGRAAGFLCFEDAVRIFWKQVGEDG